MGFISILKNRLEGYKKAEQEAKEAKEKAEREYAAKQASVDTEIVESCPRIPLRSERADLAVLVGI